MQGPITIKLSLLSVFFFCFFQAGAQLKKPDSSALHSDTSVISISGGFESMQVEGLIINAATHQPVQGVNVQYKKYSAAISDSNGRFSIKVPNDQVSLLISGAGFQTREIPLRGRREISTVLYDESFPSFYDQANLPFGAELKNRIPFATSSVQTNGAWDQNFETPSTYMQGKFSGLHVIRQSGAPNAGANLFLRGYHSLYGTNQPLIVVDGVIYDNTDYGNSLISGNFFSPLSFIDMKDIDNITVIKDGSSIYGTKGGNGVILITTARARELATRIDFAVYGGFNIAPKNLPLLNATDYRSYLSGLLPTSGLTSDQIQALPYMNDDKSNPDYYTYHNHTDWQDQLFQNSYATNYYLKITGGDNIAKYALSLGSMQNDGIITNTNVTRYNTRFNADLNISRKLTATSNLSFSFAEENLRDVGLATRTNPLYLSLVKSPLLSVHEQSNTGIESPDLSGSDIFHISNPAALLNNSLGQTKNYRFLGSVGFSYHFLRPLSLNSVIGITIDKLRENVFIPGKGVEPDTLFTAIVENQSGSQVKRLFNLFNDTRLSFSKNFHQVHELSANLGLRFIRSQTEQDFGEGYNSATDELKSVSFGLAELRRVGGNIGEWRWLNNYLNVDYSLLGKYFLSFNMALDGSSRFGDDVQSGAVHIGGKSFAVLPSIAGAWLVSSEKFMNGLSFFELLKLRASYGVSGNDDIGNYNNRQYYVSQNLLGIQGLVRGNFGNPQLQWETVKKFNAGLDLSVLKERLSFSFDYYVDHADHLIFNEPTASTAGLLYAVTNSAAIRTKGFDASVTGRMINQSSLKWDLGLNLSHYKSRISSLPGWEMTTDYGGATILSRTTRSTNLFYGLKTNGVYATDAEAAQEGLSIKSANGSLVPFRGGDVRFIDLNGDKVIDDADRDVIGNPNPDFYGSFNSHVEWKRWTFDLLFTYSKGGEVYNRVRNVLESLSGYENQTVAALNSWKTNGDVTNMPRAVWGDPMGNSRFSDRWIEDGSYLRLRSVSLSYRIPFETSFLKYIVINIAGTNIFTITNYLGYDPEFAAGESIFAQGVDTGLTPQFKSGQIGVRIGL
ncbi:MAG: SusC/RagA family TonB-linked outer membrane protein [Flavisolibacter sp.]